MTRLFEMLKNQILSEKKQIDFHPKILTSDIFILFDLMRSINKTKILNLSQILITEEIFNALNEYLLLANCELQELNLSHTLSYQANQPYMHNALKKIFQNKSLLHLKLSSNNISSNLLAISEGLAENQTLRFLDLSNNQINENDFKNLTLSLIKNTSLQTLDVGINNICDEALTSLTQIYSERQNLLTINFGCNPISQTSAFKLYQNRKLQLREQFVEQTIIFFQIIKHFNHLPIELWICIFNFIPMDITNLNTTEDQLTRMQALVAFNIFSHKKNDTKKNKDLFWKKELSKSDIQQLPEKFLTLFNQKNLSVQFLQKDSFVIFKTKSY